MAHELVSGVYGSRTAPWHFGQTGPDGRSLVVDGRLTTRRALELSGVGGLEVRREPVYIRVGEEYVSIDDYMAVVRNDTNGVVGLNGDGYQEVQFRAVFEALGFTDEEVWETMILLRGGRVAGGVLRLPEHDRLLADGSTLLSYVAAYTSHDASMAITYTDTNIRMECWNKLRAIDAGTTGRRITIRHGATAADRMVEASRIMTYAAERAAYHAAQCERLLAQPVTRPEFMALLERLIPTVPVEDRPRALTMARNRHTRIIDCYDSAPDLNGLRGTAWAVVQAVADYSDHRATYRNTKTTTADESRFIRTVVTQDTIADRALALLTV